MDRTFVSVLPVEAAPAVVFASDGSTAEVNGRIIDRLALGRNYLSVLLAVPIDVTTTGVNAGTAKITSRVTHATSTSTADMAALGSTGETTTFGTTTTSTSYTGCHYQTVDLTTANRYLQFHVTPNFVASSSGSFKYAAVALFGEADTAPSTALDVVLATEVG